MSQRLTYRSRARRTTCETKVGSLFSGYGGLDLAVGGDLAWYSEIEPAACKVMESHYPGVPNIGDVTKVDWAEVEPVDVITGGYPCQPFSNAGMRKGKDDERHLWPYVLDAIRAIRPRYAILENVSGHLTLGFDTVLTDLAKIGWAAEWGTFRASDIGAPHRRERLFIVAYSDSEGLQGHDSRGGETPTTGHGHNQQGVGSLAADAQHNGLDRGTLTGSVGESENERRLQQPERRDPDLVANTSGERHGRGERPASVERMGSASKGSGWQASTTRQESGTGSIDNAADTAGNGSQGRSDQDGVNSEASGQRSSESVRGSGEPVDWGKYAPAIRRWETILDRAAPAPTVERKDKRRLNPQFVEWMMGLPDGWVTGHGLSASQELKMLGNGVVPHQARLALELLGGVE